MLSNLKSALFPVHDSGANLRIVQFIGRLDEKLKKIARFWFSGFAGLQT